jgi:hypothetical protein
MEYWADGLRTMKLLQPSSFRSTLRSLRLNTLIRIRPSFILPVAGEKKSFFVTLFPLWLIHFFLPHLVAATPC